MTILGTDGFGHSANCKALRRFFEVDRQNVTLAALETLVRNGDLAPEVLRGAIERLGLDKEADAPWTR
ncbi:MAG: hypothetical protein R6U99_06380 [Nioella sp.]